MKKIFLVLFSGITTMLTAQTVSTARVDFTHCQPIYKSVSLYVENATYSYLGKEYAVPGVYQVSKPGSDGCDTTITLTLIKAYAFSVAYSKKVVFSPGNLRYLGDDGTGHDKWSFAEHQYDALKGTTQNTNPKQNSKNWQDLFAWGTGDQPWRSYKTAGEDADAYTWHEWGDNPIDNYASGFWRTPTRQEWYYLLQERSGHSTKMKYSVSVNGVSGLVILPDNWSGSSIPNSITLNDWTNTWEANGAIFLPTTGYNYYGSVTAEGEAFYWSSTKDSGKYAYYLAPGYAAWGNYTLEVYFGMAIRLVHNL